MCSRQLVKTKSMRLYSLLLFAYCLQGHHANAQQNHWFIGTGLGYCTYIGQPGVNLNVSYRLTGKFYIGPDFSAFLNRELDEEGKMVKRKEVEYNINAHQLFDIGKKISLYPLAGVNLSKVTHHAEGEKADKQWITALNAGGGLEWELENIRVFVETKWVSVLDKVDITTGVIFRL